MSFGDSRHDRQPEPEPAGLAAAVGAGAGEPAEDPFQVRFSDAAARVGHCQDGLPVFKPDAQLDAVAHPGVRDGVFQQRVQCRREAVAVAQDGNLGHFTQPPPAGHMAPALQRVDHQRVSRNRRQVQEARAARGGEQQEPAGEPAQPAKLADDHAGVGGNLPVGGRLLDQLRVAERDGDRRAELVRGIQQEHALLIKQAQVLLGDPLHLSHRRQPLFHGR
jgi:hypothetical protein